MRQAREMLMSTHQAVMSAERALQQAMREAQRGAATPHVVGRRTCRFRRRRRRPRPAPAAPAPPAPPGAASASSAGAGGAGIASASSTPPAPPAPPAPASASRAAGAPRSRMESRRQHLEHGSSHDGKTLKINAHGAIEFTDDDADVKSISRGGYLTI